MVQNDLQAFINRDKIKIKCHHLKKVLFLLFE